MKKIFTVLLLFVAAFTLLACTDKDNSGEVLVVRAWNTEFQTRFRDYYPDYDKTNSDGTDVLKDGTIVEWIIVANDDNGYQNALDLALENQDSASADEKVDMFLVEADYALKYVNTDYTLDVINDLGIEEDELDQQYQYTKDIVTSTDGKLKGVSWQATPGLFAYRRSIATDVLGTDDPAAVQNFISTWDKFDDVAEDMKEDGYYMLSGYDDAYRTFSNNMSNPWVNEDDEIVIDASIERWIDQTKAYSDNDYNHGASLWDSTWAADQSADGNVFGFFYSTWGINFTLQGNAGEDGFGDWAVTQGPASYYWGGTWITAAKGTDNKDLVKDIMLKLTADKDIMKQITIDTQDYTNHMTAMQELADDPDFGSDFLGGQNHVALFVESAASISMENISAYDQALNEGVQTAFRDYFSGEVATKEAAWDNFYEIVQAKHPELIRVD
ncbi:MAG: ABC transporter substrate-binding protein [Acholeplasmataceae bacterium]|nr:ABC transporter substrate-binding protein [Acholeplasmataceae bacterium]